MSDAFTEIVLRWLVCRNTSGEEIPSFGLVRIAGVDSDNTIQVAKPDTDSSTFCLLNGPAPIPDGLIGLCTRDFPAMCLYDTGDGTPAPGDEWGAGSGSFKLRSGKTGYRFLGGATGGRVLVVGMSGGGGGSPSFFPSKITARSGSAYAWTEQSPTTGGGFTNKTGGRSGTTSTNPAYEINGSQFTPNNQIVWMTEGYLNAGGAGQEYLFEGGATTSETVMTDPSTCATKTITVKNGRIESIA